MSAPKHGIGSSSFMGRHLPQPSAAVSVISSREIRHVCPLECKSVRPRGKRAAVLTSSANKKSFSVSAFRRSSHGLCSELHLNNLKRASVTFDVRRLMQMKQKIGPKRYAPLYSSRQLFIFSFFLMNRMNSSCSLRDSPLICSVESNFSSSCLQNVTVCKCVQVCASVCRGFQTSVTLQSET